MILRSRLYSLEPLGVGTPYMESVTSYIIRLADKHRVSVAALVNYEIVPEMMKDTPMCRNLANTLWKTNLRTLLSAYSYRKNIIRVLERLTHRSDLKCLNLSPLPNFDGRPGFIRPWRAWCPVCLEEAAQDGIIYDQLLWAVQVVTCCPRHFISLQEHCPNCNKSIPYSSRRGVNGYCSSCGCFLGQDNRKQEANKLDIQIANSVGKFIADLPVIASGLSRENVAKTINTIINHKFNGRKSEFSRQMGIHLETVTRWCNGVRSPNFQGILEICYKFDISITSVLSGALNSEDIKECSCPSLKDKLNGCRFGRIYLGPQIEKDFLKAILETYMTDEMEPISVRQIGKRLRIDPRSLRRFFPKECEIIRSRYLDDQANQRRYKRLKFYHHIQTVTISIHNQGIYPSSKKVIKTAGIACRDEKEARRIRRETLEKLGYTL